MLRAKYILELSLLYSLLFSTSEYINNHFFTGLYLEQDFASQLSTVLEVVLYNFSLFYLLSLNRIIFIISNFILFVTGAIVTFFVYSLNISFSYRSFLVLFETNMSTFEYAVNLKIILIVFLAAIFSYLQIKNSKLYLKPLKDDNFGQASQKLLFVIVLSTLLLLSLSSENRGFLPRSLGSAIKDYNKIYVTSNKQKQVPKSSSFNGAENLKVVLIVSESVRGDKFQLNGYNRETNPLLSKVKNLISYKKFSSCEVLSVISIPCLLTNRSIQNPYDLTKNLSFHEILEQHGFSTYWVNEHFRGLLKAEFHSISEKYGNLYNKDNLSTPEKSLPLIKKLIKRDENSLIVYHTYLSHWPYYLRYPTEFNKWQPTCSYQKNLNDKTINSGDIKTQIEQMKKCPNKSLHNEYDNAVTYLDSVISEIISTLADENAIFMYTSDHGESLGERNLFLHGGYNDRFIKEQRNVPFIVWFSDKFIKNNKEKFAKAKEILNNNLNHDYIFHSILDCAGIEGDDIDKNLSICH